MIILISGATHTGKTLLAQKLLERLHYPYLSADHLKMGLIRSGNTGLSVYDDDQLTALLWPILREMIKTAIENAQNLIVEGCYIPFNWQSDFDAQYRKHICYCCLVMSQSYIEANFAAICTHANEIEKRLDDSGLSMVCLTEDNLCNLENCRKYQLPFVLIEDNYDADSIAGRVIDVLDL